MKNKICTLITFLALHVFCFSQTDSVAFSAGMLMEDGIYLTYSDFRKNTAIKKNQINSSESKDQLEFINKTIFKGKFSYQLRDEIIQVESKNVWGFFQNNTFYINYKEDFYRVPVFGVISYLVANVTVLNNGFYDPRFGYSTGSTNTKEIKEFLIDFYSGVMEVFTLEGAERLLARDTNLYEEYNKLSRRNKKEQIYRFIRRYNEIHPVYFLK